MPFVFINTEEKGSPRDAAGRFLHGLKTRGFHAQTFCECQRIPGLIAAKENAYLRRIILLKYMRFPIPFSRKQLLLFSTSALLVMSGVLVVGIVLSRGPLPSKNGTFPATPPELDTHTITQLRASWGKIFPTDLTVEQDTGNQLEAVAARDATIIADELESRLTAEHYTFSPDVDADGAHQASWRVQSPDGHVYRVYIDQQGPSPDGTPRTRVFIFVADAFVGTPIPVPTVIIATPQIAASPTPTR